ncbi:Pycsar system effector family protein [Paenibacillus sp. GCM10028914]|uniref:Pycsar system effector family protein n=1 Tax=Paenibacillus sp. GCM10028914 TaxID=3273416 RepID=UPI00361C7663
MSDDSNKENSMPNSTFALESLKNIQELIRFIDTKASALLVVYGLILTVFMDTAKKMSFLNIMKLNFYDALISILVLLVGIVLSFLLVYQLFFIIMQVLKPRLSLNYKEDEHSIFYFEHIASMKKSDVLKGYLAANEVIMVEEIVGQVYEVSKIMKIKTYRLNKAMEYLFVNLILLLLYIFLNNI